VLCEVSIQIKRKQEEQYSAGHYRTGQDRTVQCSAAQHSTAHDSSGQRTLRAVSHCVVSSSA
jgi:hypothetical protein